MIAFLISELKIRGGTHKQFLKLLEYADTQKLEFIIVTKVVDFNLTYPGFSKFKERIVVVPDNERSRNPIKKIQNYKDYVNRLRFAVEKANIINIHDNGFELHFEAFENKNVYWQINDLQYSFVKMHNSTSSSVSDRIKLFLIRKKIIQGLKFIKRITVNVSKNKERIQKYFRRDAEVFYCGIDPVNIERNNSETINRFSQNKINLLSSGVFFPYRNYETQVLVIKELCNRGYDVNLSIIGSIELSPEYVEKINNLVISEKLQKNINICGQIDENTFESLHKNSDIFLFINVNQSWGLAVFEAMSCGLPVIVSESVGATEILTDDVNSLFVNPFNVNQIVEKIISLIKDPNYYQYISDNSRKIVEEYTWDKAYSSKMLNLMTEENGKLK